MNSRLLSACLVAGAIALSACQADAPEDTAETVAGLPSSSAQPSDPAESGSASPTDGGSGEETSVFDLEEGDCFSASGETVETVTVVDCEEPHIYEVFAIFDHEAGADDPFPGDDEILEFADTECQPLFEEYVGIDYQSSRYWITSVTPSAETWDQGDDREIVCALKVGEEGSETTGSAEGSGE